MGRGHEAEIILRRIEEQAGVTRLPPASQRPSPPVLRVSIWVLFSRAVIRRTLLAIFVNIICPWFLHPHRLDANVLRQTRDERYSLARL